LHDDEDGAVVALGHDHLAFLENVVRAPLGVALFPSEDVLDCGLRYEQDVCD
jgi:hypothetical protein